MRKPVRIHIFVSSFVLAVSSISVLKGISIYRKDDLSDGDSGNWGYYQYHFRPNHDLWLVWFSGIGRSRGSDCYRHCPDYFYGNVIFVLLSREHDVKVDVKHFHFHMDCIKKILAVGVPNACMNALNSFW